MKILLAFAILIITGCTQEEKSSTSEIYTLYRGGALDKSLRIHYATFPTKGEKTDWNKENCERIAEYLNKEEKYKTYPVKFWCEKGDFRE